MEKLYTVSEASKLLKTNVHTVYSLIDHGLLPAIKLGRLKIRDEAIEEFLKQYEGMDLSNLSDIREIE